MTLLGRLRRGTHERHVAAERSGIVAAIVSGRINAFGYALYLRNLLPAYRSMERMLAKSAPLASIGALAQLALNRAPAIAADLDALLGPRWSKCLPLLPIAKLYAARVKQAGSGDGSLLIAHAYTRYLGDLNGGRLLRRQLLQQFGPDFPLRFTEFPGIGEIDAFVTDFRAAMDRVGSQLSEDAALQVLHEGRIAFDLNIELSLKAHAAWLGMEKKQQSPFAGNGLAFPL